MISPASVVALDDPTVGPEAGLGAVRRAADDVKRGEISSVGDGVPLASVAVVSTNDDGDLDVLAWNTVGGDDAIRLEGEPKTTIMGSGVVHFLGAGFDVTFLELGNSVDGEAGLSDTVRSIEAVKTPSRSA